MTPQERQAIAALSRCTFLPGSWEKRFVRALAAKVDLGGWELTPKQRFWLLKLVHRYRKQIGERETRILLGQPVTLPLPKPRRQMTAEEYIAKLQAEESASRYFQGAQTVGGFAMAEGTWGHFRRDSERDAIWEDYESLIHRFYGTHLKAINADGTTRPWVPDELDL